MDEKANKINGSWLRYWVHKSYKIPVVGYFIRMLTAIVNLPQIMRNINEYRAFTDAKLAGKADREAVDALMATVQNHRLDILDQQRRMLILHEEMRRRFPKPLSHEQIESVLREEDHSLDAMYMSFEDRFRGTRVEIERKLRVYLPNIHKLEAKKEEFSLLDVGCGRGEWLKLLREEGYRARGIDINRAALQQCRELGLDVTESDVIEYLRGLERGSLDVITGFHLIEHLPFPSMVALFDEAFSVLKSGGMMILETPNPTNILVSAYDFYRDPSHIRPLHPDTVNFIAENRGFVRTGSYFVSDAGADVTLIKSTEWKLDDIHDYIRAPRDYAMICYKP